MINTYIDALKRGFGQPPIFTSPQHFVDYAVEYFNHCIANPIKKPEAIKSGDLAGTTMDVEVPMPFTVSGFCAYVGMSRTTFFKYRTNKEAPYGDYNYAAEIIVNICMAQKVPHALVGNYNSNLTGRLDGLSEKIEIKKTQESFDIDNLIEENKRLALLMGDGET